jgi:AraC-like DNA-binding protein
MLCMKETAFMLGYSETAAFYHAFRRWTGQSPAEFAEVSAMDNDR